MSIKYHLTFGFILKRRWIPAFAGMTIFLMMGSHSFLMADTNEFNASAINVDQAIRRALQTNEDIQISLEKIERMKNTYRKVRSEALPRVDGNFDWNKYFESPTLRVDMGGGTQEFSIKDDYEMIAGAQLNQIIFAFGKVSTAIEIAKQSIDIERLSYGVTKNELIFLVKKAYATILFAEKAVKIAKESYQNTLKNQKALNEKFKGGRVSRVDNVKMASDVENRIPVMLQAKNQLDSLRVSFRRLLQLPPNTEFKLTEVLTEEFPEYDGDGLEALMYSHEPSILALNENRARNEQLLKYYKAEYYPTLDGLANYQYGGNGPDTVPENDMDPTFYAGLQVRYPLWTSGARKGAVGEAEYDLNISQLELDKRKFGLKEELDATLSKYNSTKKVYEAALSARQLATDSYKITLSSFKAGAASQVQLNDAELQLTNAKLRALERLYDLNVFLARIDKLTAKELQ
jgi:outer membrane protein TolC